MRKLAFSFAMAAMSVAADANDWEKFFQAAPAGITPIIPATQPPVVESFSGNATEVVSAMFRKGLGALGGSSFNSPNASTKDAIRFAEKIHASNVVMATELTSSQVVNMPMQTPTSTTSYTNGNVSAYGSGGSANGTYNGTTTTYGSTTTYIPIRQNRFDKVAVYFAPMARQGVGMLLRAPTPEEVTHYESRHLLIIRAIRDGAPADRANVLEGDVIMTINGEAAMVDTYRAAVAFGAPMVLHLIRNGQPRDITIAQNWP